MDGDTRTDGAAPPAAAASQADDLARTTDSMRALARRLLRDGAAAEDAAQDAWLVALEGARPAEVPLRWWLLGVVRNVAWRLRRGEGRRRTHELAAARPEAVAATSAAAAVRAETHTRLVQAVLALDEPYRGTLLLHFFEGERLIDIAARTGTPAATVRSRLKRGLEMLRRRLDAEHAGDRRRWAVLLAPVAWPRPAGAAAASAAGGALLTAALAKGALAAAALLLVVGGGAAWIAATEPDSADEVADVASPRTSAPPNERRSREETAAVDESPSGGSIALSVRDWDGRPIAGARAEARPWLLLDAGRLPPSAPPSAVATAATRADGTAEIRGLAIGSAFEVVVHAPGRVRGREIVDVAAAAAPVTLDMQLVAESRLAGRVLAPDASPVAGAVVEVRAADDPWPWRAVADERGRFVVAGLPIGCVDVIIGPAGGRATRHAIAVRLPIAGEFDLVLPPSARIEGTVRDAATRAPLAGAVVRLSPAGPWAGADSDVTGEDGRYAIDVTEGAGFLRPRAHLDGWRASDDASAASEVALRPGRPTRCDIDLVKAGGASQAPPALGVVTGRVLGPGGRPVAGARVGRSTTGAHGAFRIEDARAGADVAWRVEAPGFADAELVATVPPPGGSARCDVTVAASARVRGTLRLEGGGRIPEGTSAVVVAHPEIGKRLVPAVVVTAVFRTARVAPDGTFTGEIAWTGAGSFRVEVRAPGRAWAQSADVALVAGTSDYAADVVIGAGVSASGRVVDEDTGKPIAGASVSAGSPWAVMALTDADGRFEIRGLGARERAAGVHARGRIGHRVQLAVGAETLVKLQREMQVSGVVVTPDGRGIADVAVSVRPLGTPVLTDADGRFVIGDLPPRPVRLEVGPATADVDMRRVLVDGIEAGRTDLRIVAELGRTLAGRVLDANGAGVPGAHLIATPEGAQEPTFRATASASGDFRLAGLADGARYAVVAYPPAASAEFPNAGEYLSTTERDVRADAGSLVIRLTRALAIEGTLVDDVGRPLAGITLAIGTRTADTDESGRFRFENLHAGTHSIALVRSPHDRGLVEVRGGERAAAGDVGVRLVGDPGGTLSGVVVGDDGSPLADVLVTAVPAALRARPSKTDANGRFEIAGVPRRPLEVRAAFGDRVPERVAGAVPGGPEVRIVMRRGLEVRGRLVDASGAPAAKAFLWFQHAQDELLSRTAVTDDDGRFCAKGFVAAAYLVGMRGGGRGMIALGTVDAGTQSEVELRIP